MPFLDTRTVWRKAKEYLLFCLVLICVVFLSAGIYLRVRADQIYLFPSGSFYSSGSLTKIATEEQRFAEEFAADARASSALSQAMTQVSVGKGIAGYYYDNPETEEITYYQYPDGIYAEEILAIAEYTDVFFVGLPGRYGTSLENSRANTYTVLEAGYRYLLDTQNYAESEITVFGFSMGGYYATYVASRFAPKRLVLVGTFDTVRGSCPLQTPLGPLCIFAAGLQDQRRLARQVEGTEVFQFHSVEDELVPYADGENLFGHFSEPKKFAPLRGSHHDYSVEEIYSSLFVPTTAKLLR